jgi:hypothetical protein
MPVDLSVLFQRILTTGLSDKNVSCNSTLVMGSEHSLVFEGK